MAVSTAVCWNTIGEGSPSLRFSARGQSTAGRASRRRPIWVLERAASLFRCQWLTSPVPGHKLAVPGKGTRQPVDDALEHQRRGERVGDREITSTRSASVQITAVVPRIWPNSDVVRVIHIDAGAHVVAIATGSDLPTESCRSLADGDRRLLREQNAGCSRRQTLISAGIRPSRIEQHTALVADKLLPGAVVLNTTIIAGSQSATGPDRRIRPE